jgi:hypothetical protein
MRRQGSTQVMAPAKKQGTASLAITATITCAITTGNEGFAECQNLCRVQKLGHSAKSNFAECSAWQSKTHGKFTLCRVSGTQQNKTLGKDYFAECQTLGKE